MNTASPPVEGCKLQAELLGCWLPMMSSCNQRQPAMPTSHANQSCCVLVVSPQPARANQPCQTTNRDRPTGGQPTDSSWRRCMWMERSILATASCWDMYSTNACVSSTSACIFIYIYIYMYIYLFIDLFINWFIYVFIYLFMYLFVYLCFHVFMYLCVYLFKHV